MPYIVHLNSASSVSKEFEPEIDGRLKASLSRRALSSEERAAIPRTLIIGTRGKGAVPAIIGWSVGPFLVCQRLRDLLEELEPGRHDFVPIKINSKTPISGKTDHGIYFLILFPPRLDAVVIDETAFTKGFGREGFEKSAGHIFDDDEKPCVLEGSVIEGHHLWQLPENFGHDPDYPGSGYNAYFCSDELWRRIEAGSLDGWDTKKRCIVKQPVVM